METMPPECVRVSPVADAVYFVYKSDNGHYAFWLYDFGKGTENVRFKCYFGKPVPLSVFEK